MPDSLVTMLVVRLPDNVSIEGAQHHMGELWKAAEAQGCTFLANTIGATEKPAEEARRLVNAFWRTGSSCDVCLGYGATEGCHSCGRYKEAE